MLLAFIMGCTCVGKSTLLTHAARNYPALVGLVEVGKALRAKYLDPSSPFYDPDYFKGQAAPKHTQVEAWDICERQIREHVAAGKRLILIDGQPRSLDQVENCFTRLDRSWPKAFVLLDASLEERERRLAMRFRLPDEQHQFDLGKQRLVNDMVTYYTVLTDLIRRGQHVDVFDFNAPSLPVTMHLLFQMEHNSRC